MKVRILIFLALIFFQCENDLVEDCSVPAIVRDLTGLDGCGWVFELQDGTKLEPHWQWGWCGTPPLPEGQTEDPLYDFEYEEGKKVIISYEQVEGGASICMVGPLVKITYIKEVASVPEE